MKIFMKVFKIISLSSIIVLSAACGGNKTEKTVDPNSILRIEAMNDIHKKEREMLTTYGVIDQKAGIYRIPIDRAMEVIAAKSN